MNDYVNKATVTGTVVEIEKKRLPSGVACINMEVKTLRTIHTADGEKSVPEWHKISAYGDVATQAPLLVEDCWCKVTGVLRTRGWKTATGETRKVTEIIADSIEAVKDDAVLPTHKAPGEASAPGGYNDDLTF